MKMIVKQKIYLIILIDDTDDIQHIQVILNVCEKIHNKNSYEQIYLLTVYQPVNDEYFGERTTENFIFAQLYRE